MSLTITVPEPLAQRLQSRAEVERVPVEELTSRLLESGIQRPLEPAAWNIANERRVILIEKRFAGGLTDEEQLELQRLQDLADQQLEELDALMLRDVARMEDNAREFLRANP
jgi:hypothetical protein